MNQTTIQNQVVKVGDSVGFKSDVEQAGTIKAIRRNSSGIIELVLCNPHGFSGEYLHGSTETVEFAQDCWL